jgi:hypothetical protein
MAEEIKESEGKTEGKNVFSVFLKVVLGLLFLALGFIAIIRWWVIIVMLIKGCIGPFLILAGIVTLAIAKD